MKGQDVPDRLRDRGATDLERRLLKAGAHEEPAPELRERMAQGIGVSLGSLGGSASESAWSAAKAKAPAGAKVGASSTSVLPWVAAGVLGLAISGTIVGTRLGKDERSHEAPTAETEPLPSQTSPAAAPPERTARGAAEAPPAPVLSRRDRISSTSGSLRDQIALVDSARTAVANNAGDRAIELLRQYQDRYPMGSFRPEVAVLRVDALMKLGRTVEARSAAKRFVAEFGPGPLADRVLRVAGLTRP
jgi:hypothetical protein